MTQSTEQLQEHRLYAARELLIRWIDEHRRTCPLDADTDECPEPGNTLAWLAHCLGIRESDLKTFQRRVLDWDLNCTGCTSPRDVAPAQPPDDPGESEAVP